MLLQEKQKKNSKAITLIALVITIVILLILSGVVISTLTGENGLFARTKQAKIQTRYTNAKETIEIKIMEVATECYSNGKEYNLKEISEGIKEANNITIEKYYNGEIAKIKNGITENIVNLTGIIVSVDEYSEYKFLLGKECNIIGVTTNNITDTTEKTEFKNIEDFEKDMLGGKIGIDDNKESPKDEIAQIPEIDDSIDITKSIEISTYISVKSNTNTTLTVNNVDEAKFTVENSTDNIILQNNILKINDKANSKDSCKIKITGVFNGQSYINHLTVYVEPKKTTIIDDDGNEVGAFGIYNEDDFLRLEELISNKAVSNNCNIKLMNNLELNSNLYNVDENGKITFEETAKEYNKIGTTDNPYSGIFDGNNKYISGLIIKMKANETTNGLFGMVSKDGIIKNLTIKNSIFNGNRTGGIAGYNEGKIYRCKSEVITIEDNSSICWNGGIVGVNNGDIIECSTHAYLACACVGGIAGANGSDDSRDNFKHNLTTGRIYRCYSTGYIGYSQVGGIASHNGIYGGEGYIYDCYSTAKLEDNFWNGSIVAIQSYQGRGGYINNSYYLNIDCNFPSVVTPRYYGNVTNSYSNDITITTEKLNGESRNVWTNDTCGINNGYPILKWQLER